MAGNACYQEVLKYYFHLNLCISCNFTSIKFFIYIQGNKNKENRGNTMSTTYLSYANAPFWGFLPMGMTNFGGDIQVFTVPEYANGQIGMLLNPQAQAALSGTSFMPWGLQIPPVTPQSVQEYAQNLLNPALNNLASASINTSMQNIAMTKTRLNAMLQQDSITDEQKTKINELLDKLEEQEEKLKELTQSTDLKPEEAYKKAKEIESEIRKIVNEVVELGKAISGTTTSTTEETTSTQEETSTQENNSTEESEETEENEGKTNIDKFSPEVVEMVDVFNDAIHVWDGTDNDAFNAVCANINKDNVLEVMLAWNKYHSGQDGESFMEAFMWDANATQKKQFGKLIARALRDRAEELGVYDDCAADFAKIDKELNSLLWISNDISEQFENIVAIMAEKVNSPYGSKLGKGETTNE